MNERRAHIVSHDIPLEQIAQRAEELYPQLKGARMPIIECAARAAAEAMGYDYDEQDGPTADPNTPMTEDLRAAIIAVLQAIREPSDAATLAGAQVMADVANLGDCGGPAPISEFSDSARDCWRAMIDAALEGESP